MNILGITETQFFSFFLIFIRVSGILFAAPLFGNPIVPNKLRISLGLVIALILTPVIQLNPWSYTPGPFIFLYLVVGELLIGLIIGFAAKLLFAGVQLSGQLIGYQMGFAIANVLDPISGSQISLFAEFEHFVALLIFLSINAHHLFIKAIVNSFQLIQPLQFQPQGIMFEKIIAMAGKMFVLAVQVGAPIIVVLLFTNVFFGIMARTVPEMNIFIVAMPLGIAIGLFALGISMPFLANLLTKTFHTLSSDLMVLMKGM